MNKGNIQLAVKEDIKKLEPQILMNYEAIWVPKIYEFDRLINTTSTQHQESKNDFENDIRNRHESHVNIISQRNTLSLFNIKNQNKFSLDF